MLGVAFNNTLPLTSADFPVDLAVNFLHEIVSIAFVMKHVTAAGFTSKNCLPVWIENAPDFGIHKHGVAVRTERPGVCGVPGYV